MESRPDFITVADVVKAVGLKGEIKLYPWLDWHEPLLDSAVLEWEDGTPLEISSWRFSGGCYVMRIAGIEDRNAAEAAVGRRIGFLRSRYDADDFPKPADGLPFRYLGRTVEDLEGTSLGIVTEVRRYGAQFTLVLRHDGREVLIPALEPILHHNVAVEGPLVVDPPEGLLDVAGD